MTTFGRSSVGAAQHDLARIRAAGLLCWRRRADPDMLQRLESRDHAGRDLSDTRGARLLALSAWRANDNTGGAEVAGSDCQ